MYKYLCVMAIIVFGVFEQGCSGNPTAEVGTSMANNKLDKEFFPMRAVLKGNGVITFEWAGVTGKSIIENSPQVKSDTFAAIQKACGFMPSELFETRAVRRSGNMIYEVWVFNDAHSSRPDHQTGLSVLLNQLSGNGGVDINIRGNCHS